MNPVVKKVSGVRCEKGDCIIYVMKKIIHLSDLHVGHEECGKNFLRIINKISKTKKPARDYIIVITGDISDNANHSEYTDEAVKAVQLLEKRGYRVLVVPGNHDYGNGAAGKKKFVAIFKEKFYGSTAISYPKVDNIGRTAFIGLDSTAEELHWYDRFVCEGELGKEQLKRLKDIMMDEKVMKRKKEPDISETLYFPPIGSQTWETVSPASLGWNTNALTDLYTFLSQSNTRAFIILVNGRLAVEQYDGIELTGSKAFTGSLIWYRASAGKSLTSFLTGIARQEGLIDIENKISDYLGKGWTSMPIAFHNEMWQKIKLVIN